MPWRFPLILRLFFIVLLLSFPCAVQAATITVNDTGDDILNDGDCTLREAITAANSNTASGGMGGECAAGDDVDDTIDFRGLAGCPCTITLSIATTNEDANADGDLDITTGDLTIDGSGAANTIIDANSIDRVFHIVSNGLIVEINDLTIMGGQETTGGGLRVSGNAFNETTVDGVIFDQNDATEDGGTTEDGGPTLPDAEEPTGSPAPPLAPTVWPATFTTPLTGGGWTLRPLGARRGFTGVISAPDGSFTLEALP